MEAVSELVNKEEHLLVGRALEILHNPYKAVRGPVAVVKNRKQGRVLIVDDQEDWRNLLVELLQEHNYYVSCATTTEEALQLLTETHYHIMILTNRMAGGSKDGMELLRDLERRGLGDSVKVIMLSTYGTKEQMRQAFRDYKVVDFLPKRKFDKRTFSGRIEDVFSRDIDINLALNIHWQSPCDAKQAVAGMEIEEGHRVEPGTFLQRQLADELEDLLCRLFASAKSILVHSITAGWSGTRVLVVQPFYTSGSGCVVAVKFGNAQQIGKEYHNYKEFVEPSIVGSLSTAILTVRRVQQLGGIVYVFLGASHDPLESFGTFYRHATIAQIKNALTSLFRETCGVWYANTSHLLPHDLTEDYQQLFGLHNEGLKQIVAQRLKSVRDEQELYFQTLHSKGPFTNPLLISTHRRIVYPTYVCTTHGDFNQNNLLVDTTGHMWMIDFQSTGPGHILRDVAMLDSVIRFQLLGPTDATLMERLIMEEELCSIEHFSQVDQLAERFVTANPSVMKAYLCVTHLRLLARQLVQHNPSDDIHEYYAALFYNALSAIRFDSMSPLQCEHALLCASLLADRLKLNG